MSRSQRGNSDSSSSQGPTKSTTSSTTSTSSGQTFSLAHPVPKSNSNKPRQGLRLSTRLCLQVQQLQISSRGATRVLPILELYQPSTFGKNIVLPGGGTRKVHGRDLYLTQGEEYAHLRKRSKKTEAAGNGYLSVNGNGNGNGVANGHGHTTKPRSGSGGSALSTTGTATLRPKSRSSYDSRSISGSGDESEWNAKANKNKNKNGGTDGGKSDELEDDVVAIIHTSPKARKDKTSNTTTGISAPDAELFFPLSGRTFDATSPSPGVYRFQCQSAPAGGSGNVVFTWEKRPPSRSHSSEKDDGERFVLSVCESAATSSGQGPWLAQLSRRGMHVSDLNGWADCRALLEQGRHKGGSGSGSGSCGGQGAGGLYTLILTMGVWVARGEGWVV